MDPKFYYFELLDEILNSYNENSIDELVKKNSKNNNQISNKINADTQDCFLKGNSNYDKLNSGGLNENYDYEENDTKIKELSDALLTELNVSEESLNQEAIDYSNFIQNINNQKNLLFNKYQQQLKLLKDNYEKEVKELDISLSNKNYKNIEKIIDLISISQENISRYYCEINTIDKIINNLKKNIQNFINFKNNNINIQKSEFTEELELEELNNIDEEVFIKMENRIKNNFSNNIYYISLNKLIVNLENQKKQINDYISKEQLNINKITFLLMKNRWFETAKIVDAKITSLIDSIKKNYILTADEAQENNFDINFLLNQDDKQEQFNGINLNELQELNDIDLPEFNLLNKNNNFSDFIFNNINNDSKTELNNNFVYNRVNKFNLQNP